MGRKRRQDYRPGTPVRALLDYILVADMHLQTEHVSASKPQCVGVLGAGSAGRWISSGPPTEAPRATGASCSVHLFFLLLLLLLLLREREREREREKEREREREKERSENILTAKKAFH